MGQKKRVTNVMKTRSGVSAAVIPAAAARCHSKTREKMLSSLRHKSVKNKNNTTETSKLASVRDLFSRNMYSCDETVKYSFFICSICRRDDGEKRRFGDLN